jgi:hypothetical protein
VAHDLHATVATEQLTNGQLVEAEITWSQVAFLVEGDTAAIDHVRAQTGAGVARLRYGDVVDLVEPWMRKFGYAEIPGVDRGIPHWTAALAHAKSEQARHGTNAVGAVREILTRFSGIEATDPVGFAHALRAASGPASGIDGDARAWVRKWASDPGFQQQLAVARAAMQAARDADQAYRRAVCDAASTAPKLHR